MSNTAKLTLQVTDTGFDKIGTDLKTVATEATKANASLKTTTSNVDNVSKSTTTLGSKLKSAGSTISSTVANVGVLAVSLINLQRSYRDLGVAQIGVDKANLKLSRSHEAVDKLQRKVNQLLAEGKQNTDEYKQALLDLQQAQQALGVATSVATEKQKHFNDAQQDFWVGLVPTIISTGGTVQGMLASIGGEQGLGGLATKLHSLPGLSKMSMTSMAASIGLVTAAAGVAFIGIQKIFDLMEQKKTLLEEMANIQAGTANPAQIQKSIDDMKKLQGDWSTQFRDFFAGGPLGKTLFGPTTKEIGDQLIKEWGSLKSRMESQKMMQGLMDSVVKDPTILSEVKSRIIPLIQKILDIYGNKNNWDTTKYGTIEQVRANTVKILIEAMTNLTGDVTLMHVINQVPTGLTGALADAFKKQNPFAGLMGETLKQAMTMSAGGGISAGPDWITTAMNKPAADLKAKMTEAASIVRDKITEMSGRFPELVKASADAAAKIAADQKQAALEYETAWNKAFGVQQSALDKIFAAYHKLHPGSETDILDKHGKKIGTRKTEPGKLPVDLANKAMEQFESGLAHIITSPASAKTYATNWITTAAAHMRGIAGQLISPITTYIKEHSKDAPDAFLAGLKATIAGYDSTKVFQEYLQPGVHVGGEMGTTAGNVMAKNINYGLKDIKVPPSTISVLNAQLAKVKADMAKKPATITVTSNATQAIQLAQQARARINDMHATINVTPNFIGFGHGGGLDMGFAGGFSGVVRKPTNITVGEGGREERVSVTPIGSTGHSGNSGGGGSTHITISFEPSEFKQFLRYSINEDQGYQK